jgi:hypothetical protein
MLWMMGWALAIFGTIGEVGLVTASPRLKALYLHGTPRVGIPFTDKTLIPRINGRVWNFVVSLLLSWIISKMFGAGGMTMAFGGMVGGVLSDVTFSILRSLEDKGWPLERIASEYKAKREYYAERAVYVFTVTYKCIRYAWLIVTAPVRASMWLKNTVVNAKAAGAEYKARALAAR